MDATWSARPHCSPSPIGRLEIAGSASSYSWRISARAGCHPNREGLRAVAVRFGDEDGELTVLAHGRQLKKITDNDMGNAVYTTPVASNGVLYVVNRNTLFAIQKK